MDGRETSDARIGALLGTARRGAGLTQVEAARRLGTSQTRIARLEAGLRRLTFAQAIEMARLYGVEITAFVPKAADRP